MDVGATEKDKNIPVSAYSIPGKENWSKVELLYRTDTEVGLE